MAHGSFRLLRVLLSQLDDARNDIFIHLDAKVAAPPYDELRSALRHSGLFFTEKRYDVSWGRSLQSLAELELFATAAARGGYSRYTLMSGVCLPLKTQDDIHRFLDAPGHRGKNFLKVHANFSIHDYRRLSHYHFGRRDPFSRLLKHTLKLFPWIDRIKGRFPIYRAGYNWCSLTQEAVSYLVERKEEIRQLLKHTSCADEVYKQIYLLNEPKLNESLVRDQHGRTHSIWRIDWGEGGRHPRTYTMEDVPALLKSPRLYARKFSEEHMDAVLAIAHHLKPELY